MIEFGVLMLLSSIATLYATPRQLGALRRANISFPMGNSFAILQGILLCAVGAGLGTALRTMIGFGIVGRPEDIAQVLTATFFGFLGHLVIYYVVFRPCLPRKSMALAEQIRLGMGLPARQFQGGLWKKYSSDWV